MIIVTGCGRAGTQYMWQALNAAGIRVGHEEWGIDGQIGFHAAIERRGAALNRAWRDKADPDDVILHQIREPLGNISSVQTFQDYSWDFICEHSAIKRDDPLILRCMQYWCVWNRKASDMAVFRYKIEEVQKEWPTICGFLGIPTTTPLMEETRKGWHHRTHTDLTWDDLESTDKDWARIVMDNAKEYGYTS